MLEMPFLLVRQLYNCTTIKVNGGQQEIEGSQTKMVSAVTPKAKQNPCTTSFT